MLWRKRNEAAEQTRNMQKRSLWREKRELSSIRGTKLAKGKRKNSRNWRPRKPQRKQSLRSWEMRRKGGRNGRLYELKGSQNSKRESAGKETSGRGRTRSWSYESQKLSWHLWHRRLLWTRKRSRKLLSLCCFKRGVIWLLKALRK